MLKKTAALFLGICLILQQTGIAQLVPEISVPAYLQANRPIDSFRPIHLRSIAFDLNRQEYHVLLDKGNDAGVSQQQATGLTGVLLDYFKIGLTLPNTCFWVNLRPQDTSNMIDPYLEQTDLGKIMLAADVQLKKDLAAFTSPDSREGMRYWNALYEKAEALMGSEGVEIPTMTRPWIVPGEIILRQTENGVYVAKAVLKVMLEEDYRQEPVVSSDPRLQALNEYSSELIRKHILPRLTREVNSSRKYAQFRQAYYSLVLAQWFKSVPSRLPASLRLLADSKNLKGLTSKIPWSKDELSRVYNESFSKGEYSKMEAATGPRGIVVRRYFSGGIKMGGIGVTLVPAKGFFKPNVFEYGVTFKDGGNALLQSVVPVNKDHLALPSIAMNLVVSSHKEATNYQPVGRDEGPYWEPGDPMNSPYYIEEIIGSVKVDEDTIARIPQPLHERVRAVVEIAEDLAKSFNRTIPSYTSDFGERNEELQRLDVKFVPQVPSDAGSDRTHAFELSRQGVLYISYAWLEDLRAGRSAVIQLIDKALNDKDSLYATDISVMKDTIDQIVDETVKQYKEDYASASKAAEAHAAEVTDHNHYSFEYGMEAEAEMKRLLKPFELILYPKLVALGAAAVPLLKEKKAEVEKGPVPGRGLDLWRVTGAIQSAINTLEREANKEQSSKDGGNERTPPEKPKRVSYINPDEVIFEGKVHYSKYPSAGGDAESDAKRQQIFEKAKEVWLQNPGSEIVDEYIEVENRDWSTTTATSFDIRIAVINKDRDGGKKGYSIEELYGKVSIEKRMITFAGGKEGLVLSAAEDIQKLNSGSRIEKINEGDDQLIRIIAATDELVLMRQEVVYDGDDIDHSDAIENESYTKSRAFEMTRRYPGAYVDTSLRWVQDVLDSKYEEDKIVTITVKIDTADKDGGRKRYLGKDVLMSETIFYSRYSSGDSAANGKYLKAKKAAEEMVKNDPDLKIEESTNMIKEYSGYTSYDDEYEVTIRVVREHWTKDGGQEVGGVDLRNLPASTKMVAAVDISKLPKVEIADMVKEWQSICAQISSGPMPYAQMKNYVIACCQKSSFGKEKAQVSDYVSALLRMEEERAVETAPELKEVLAFL